MTAEGRQALVLLPSNGPWERRRRWEYKASEVIWFGDP